MKCYVSRYLPKEIYNQTLQQLKELHREVWNRMREETVNQGSQKNAAVTEEISENKEEGEEFHYSFGGDLEFDINIVQEASAIPLGSSSDADDAVDAWMNEKITSISWKNYLKAGDDSKKCPSLTMLTDYIAHVDILKWFRLEGCVRYPEISLLARIHLSKMTNSGFQERFFSTASMSMSQLQTRMGFDMFEQRSILYANREEIEKKLLGYHK